MTPVVSLLLLGNMIKVPGNSCNDLRHISLRIAIEWTTIAERYFELID